MSWQSISATSANRRRWRSAPLNWVGERARQFPCQFEAGYASAQAQDVEVVVLDALAAGVDVTDGRRADPADCVAATDTHIVQRYARMAKPAGDPHGHHPGRALLPGPTAPSANVSARADS